jgi:hypothetical protein
MGRGFVGVPFSGEFGIRREKPADRFLYQGKQKAAPA